MHGERGGTPADQPRGQRDRRGDHRNDGRQADHHTGQQRTDCNEGRQQRGAVDQQQQIARDVHGGGHHEDNGGTDQNHARGGGGNGFTPSAVLDDGGRADRVDETPPRGGPVTRRRPQWPAAGTGRRRRTRPHRDPTKACRWTLHWGWRAGRRGRWPAYLRSSRRTRWREQRPLTAGAPSPLPVAHVPPCSTPGAHLNHADQPKRGCARPGEASRGDDEDSYCDTECR